MIQPPQYLAAIRAIWVEIAKLLIKDDSTELDCFRHQLAEFVNEKLPMQLQFCQNTVFKC